MEGAVSYIETYKQEHIARRHRLYGKMLLPIAKIYRPPPPPPEPPAPPWKLSGRLASIMTLTPLLPGRPSGGAILDLVSLAHGVKVPDIIGRRRKHKFVLARAHAIAMMCEYRRDMSLPQIGRLMGGLDHTTVMHHRDNWSKTADRIPNQVAAVHEQLDRFSKLPISSDAEPIVG